MRFVTFQYGHQTGAGYLLGQYVYDLAASFFRTFRRPHKFPDLRTYLEADGLERMRDVAFNELRDDPTCAIPVRKVRLRAPIPRPPKIIGVGLNYRDHAREQGKEPPEQPVLFAKAPNVVIGPGDAIEIPKGISEQVDYEVELAIVIGKAGFRISKTEALRYVFGYTVLNDVSARDIQYGDKQWFRGKSFHTFAPMGPLIVTPDECNVESLELMLKVNDEVMQKGNTQDLIFDIPYLVEFASACFPLEVGDVVTTGTPAGVGVFRSPPRFLKPGDRVEATIQGIGTLENAVR